jgi:NAD(P)-dependent dehydrogenase (short-subunit alcohol dehydrogenase family)
LCNLGAKVVFGDIQSEARERQAQKLSTFPSNFVKTDVTKYDDLIALFDTALKTFGKVDCAIPNAGVVEIGNWVDPDLDLEAIKRATLYVSLYTKTTNAPQRSPTSKP